MGSTPPCGDSTSDRASGADRRSESPPDPLDPLIGRTLGGHYSIERRLGAGAMGVVYRARHTLLGQPFAVKVISPALAGDPEVRRRFLLEARSLSLFAHRHAVQVRHCGDDDGLLYLAMDLIEGESLAALLARAGRLSESRAASIAVQILAALEEAHFASIVHRDLKPGNVMIQPMERPDGGIDDRVRVVDFGLARLVGPGIEAFPSAVSRGGRVIGTVAYMSPEQLRAADDVDGRSDLFSVGVVLYESLSGRLPFIGDSTISTALAILSREPSPMPPEVSDASPAMRAVIDRALSKDRDHRFQSAGEFAEAIRSAVSRASAPPPRPTGPIAEASPSAPPVTRRSRSLVRGAALALVVLALVAFFTLRASHEDSAASDRAAVRESLLDGRFDESLEGLARLVSSGAATGEDLLDRAEARIELGDAGAQFDLEAAATRLPRDPRIPWLQGRLAWLVLHDAGAASHALSQALLRDPSFVDARVERVRMRAAQVRLTEADADLVSVEADPTDSRGPMLRSLVDVARASDPSLPDAEKRRALDDALGTGEKAAALDPRAAEAAEQWANALVSSALDARFHGDHARSRAELETAEVAATEALRRAVADRTYRRQGRAIGRLYLSRAHVHDQSEFLEGMKADFDQVLRRRPNDPLSRSFALFATRFLDQRAVIRKAEELFRATGDAASLFDAAFGWQLLGQERAAVGDQDGALDFYARAVATYDRGHAQQPTSSQMTLYRGEARVLRARVEGGPERDRDLDLAEKDFERSLRGVPGDRETYLRRSALYGLRGDSENALADLEKAVGDDRGCTPRYYQEYARALMVRAQTEAAEGRKEEARVHLRRVPEVLAIALERRPEILPRVLPVLATSRARLAALEEAPPDHDTGLAAARADRVRLDEAVAAARDDERPRLAATAAVVRAEIAWAAGDVAKAVEEMRAALSLRETEVLAQRWSRDAAWTERLADFLEASGHAEEAKSLRTTAETQPR